MLILHKPLCRLCRVPELIALPIIGGSNAYLNWLHQNTAKGQWQRGLRIVGFKASQGFYFENAMCWYWRVLFSWHNVHALAVKWSFLYHVAAQCTENALPCMKKRLHREASGLVQGACTASTSMCVFKCACITYTFFHTCKYTDGFQSGASASVRKGSKQTRCISIHFLMQLPRATHPQFTLCNVSYFVDCGQVTGQKQWKEDDVKCVCRAT